MKSTIKFNDTLPNFSFFSKIIEGGSFGIAHTILSSQVPGYLDRFYSTWSFHGNQYSVCKVSINNACALCIVFAIMSYYPLCGIYVILYIYIYIYRIR